MSIRDRYCSKCKKRNEKLLNCAMCRLIVHPKCFLIDFPHSNVTEKRNWLCEYCRIIDSDLIIDAKLNKGTETRKVTYEDNLPNGYFKFYPIDESSENNGRNLGTGDRRYFYNLNDDTYSLVRDIDLSDIFPVEDGYDFADEGTDFVIINRWERHTGNSTVFLVQEESFISEKDSTSEEVGSEDEYDSDESEEYYTFTDCVDVGEHFYVQWTEVGTEIVKTCEVIERERYISEQVKRKRDQRNSQLGLPCKKRIKRELEAVHKNVIQKTPGNAVSNPVSQLGVNVPENSNTVAIYEKDCLKRTPGNCRIVNGTNNVETKRNLKIEPPERITEKLVNGENTIEIIEIDCPPKTAETSLGRDVANNAKTTLSERIQMPRTTDSIVNALSEFITLRKSVIIETSTAPGTCMDLVPPVKIETSTAPGTCMDLVPHVKIETSTAPGTCMDLVPHVKIETPVRTWEKLVNVNNSNTVDIIDLDSPPETPKTSVDRNVTNKKTAPSKTQIPQTADNIVNASENPRTTSKTESAPETCITQNVKIETPEPTTACVPVVATSSSAQNIKIEAPGSPPAINEDLMRNTVPNGNPPQPLETVPEIAGIDLTEGYSSEDSMDLDESARTTFYEENLNCYHINHF